MKLLVVIFGLLVKGCSFVSLPGLQGLQTDQEFSQTFGIIPSKLTNDEKAATHNGQLESKSTDESQEHTHVPQLPRNGNLPPLNVLSKMSAVQLLQSLGVDILKHKEYGHLVKGTLPRGQHETGSDKNTNPETLSNSFGKATESQTSTKDHNGLSNILHSNAINNHQQGHNIDTNNAHTIDTNQQYNGQIQTNPLYMMSAGMNGQTMSKVSNIKPQAFSGSSKLFDPDSLMQRLMSSATPFKGNEMFSFPSGGDGNQFHPLSTQEQLNHDSTMYAKMNFKPDALLMPAGKQSSHYRESYNPDQVNNYQGKFRPGQMFPSGSLQTSMQQPSRQYLFNADILNKNLMSSSENKAGSTNTQDGSTEAQNEVPADFAPSFLFPQLLKKNFMHSEAMKRTENKFLDDAPWKLDNEAIVDDEDNSTNPQTEHVATNSSKSILSSSNVTSTISPTSIANLSENGPVPDQNGETVISFVPGSLTGDGKTFQTMINNGMYDPNKINQPGFGQIPNNNIMLDKNGSGMKATSGFNNVLASFNPSSVNEALMGSLQENQNRTYNANEVNQQAFVNPFANAQSNNYDSSAGMFDNSQFLGSFDPNRVNFDKDYNKSEMSFDGKFNPSSVNKAYFDPNEVNGEKMNFDPSAMLEKNPGYDKDAAGSYNFDPNKVNDAHMFLMPPFVRGNSTGNNNRTKPRFVPGLLTGGESDGEGSFDPSKLKTDILFNPAVILHNNTKDQTDGSVLEGGMKDMILELQKFDPSAVNKLKMNFNPFGIMEHIISKHQPSDGKDSIPYQGHGHHDKVD